MKLTHFRLAFVICFILITFTTGSIKMIPLAVFKILVKNEICQLYCVALQQTSHHGNQFSEH